MINQKMLKKKFVKAYANVPISLRGSEIVAVVEKRPLTFKDIYDDLDNPRSEKALQNMNAMQII